MAYSTTNQPFQVLGSRFGGLAANSTSVYSRVPNLWMFLTTDGTTAVNNAGYFTDGKQLGMKRGDVLLSVHASTESSTGHMLSFGILYSSNSSAGWNCSTDSRLTSSGQ